MYKFTLLFIIISYISCESAHQCFDPSQPIGNCSKCKTGDLLLERRCFNKIRGCLNHILKQQNVICGLCQNGYVAQDQICIRQALLKKKQQPIPPVDVEKPPTLTLSQIQSKIKKKLQQQKEKNQKVFEIEQNSSNTPKKTANNILKNDLPDEIKLIILRNYAKLLSLNVLEVYEIGSIGNTQFIVYLFQNGQKLIVSCSDHSDQITAREKEKVYDVVRLIPSTFLKSQIEEIQQALQYYSVGERSAAVISQSISFNLEIKVKIQKKYYHLLVNIDKNGTIRIIEKNYTSQGKISQFQEMLGNLWKIEHQRNQELLGILSSSEFETAYKHFLDDSGVINIPDKIKYIQKQSKGKFTEFSVVFSPLQRAILRFDRQNKKPYNVGYYMKNINIIKNELQEEKKQSTDKEAEGEETQEKKEKEEEGIEEENEVEKPIANQQEAAHEPSINNASKPIRREYKLEEIINFLKEKDSFLGETFKVLNYQTNYSQSQSSISYNISVLTLQGKRDIELMDKDGQLSLLSSVANAPETCSEISLKRDETSQKLNKFLKKKYPLLARYEEPLIQYRLKRERESYRFLYANSALKKIELIVDYKIKEKKYVIKKSLILNYGYEIKDKKSISVEEVEQQCLQKYQRYLSQEKNFSLALAYGNDTHLKLYFSNQNYTYEFSKKLDEAAGKLTLVESKKKQVFPLGFRAENMLSEFQQKEDKNLKAFLEEIRGKYGLYFKDAPVEFVERKKCQNKTKYEVVFKTNFGYFSAPFECEDNSTKIDSIHKTEMISFHSSQHCIKNLQGKCIECKEGFKMEFEQCYKEIQGCEIQLGNTCVLCSHDYVLRNKKCGKDCSLFI